MIIAHHPKSQDKTLCGVVHSAHPNNELRPITPRGRRPWCVDDACALGWGEDMTQAMVVGAKAAGCGRRKKMEVSLRAKFGGPRDTIIWS